MKTLMKRCLSIFLSALMLITSVPAEVFAQQENPEIVPIKKLMQGKSNELCFDLRSRAEKGIRFFYNLSGCGPKHVAELQALVDDYIKLYTEVSDLLFMAVPEIEKSEDTLLEILAKRYASDKKYDVYSVAKNKVNSKLNELKRYKKFLNNIKYGKPYFEGLPPRVEYDDVKKMGKIYEKLFDDDGEATIDLFMYDRVPTLKFAKKAEKEKFLRELWDEVSKGSDELFQGLVVHDADNITVVITRLQEAMARLGEKAASKSSIKANYIPKAIEILKGLKTKKAQREFIAEIQGKLTKQQKELIREVYSQGDEVVLKLIEDSVTEAGKKASKVGQTAGKAAKGAGKKILTNGALLIVGSLLTMAMVTMVDTKNNSFAQATNPSKIKERIANGEAEPYEILAFYNSAKGQQEILDDPLRFASWLLSLKEGVTNGKSMAVFDDEMLEIKDWNPLNRDILEGIDNTKI